VGHAEALYQALQQARPDVPMVLVTGQMKKNQREELLAEIKQNHYQVMVATGGVVGEGFDWPALDHLFLTFPFSWRGKAIQYVGRVQRVAAGKTQALVYDYVDSQVNIFRAMQYKRRRAYTELEVTAQEYENLCRHCGDQVRVDKI
jgi:superfamily II DNA or RNA helicase